MGLEGNNPLARPLVTHVAVYVCMFFGGLPRTALLILRNLSLREIASQCEPSDPYMLLVFCCCLSGRVMDDTRLQPRQPAVCRWTAQVTRSGPGAGFSSAASQVPHTYAACNIKTTLHSSVKRIVTFWVIYIFIYLFSLLLIIKCNDRYHAHVCQKHL